MPVLVPVFLVMLMVGIVAMAGGYALCTNTDETPASIIGGLIVLLGVPIFAIGLVGTPPAFSAHRNQQREEKLKTTVAEKLLGSGNSHVEFHKLDGALVASYVNPDYSSCAAMVEKLEYRKCLNEPNGPIYTKSLQLMLSELIAAQLPH